MERLLEAKKTLHKCSEVIMETEKAKVMKDAYPKAQYHFLIVSKEDISNVTALTREHLPLLDHMKELANEIIEKQNHLPSSSFLIGFKINAFMNGLNMHVISNDFYSVSMRRNTHWNGFNTDLFLSYQAVYALLRVRGSVETLPDDKVQELRKATQMHCNQCDFETISIVSLKGHLFEHWQKRNKDFETKKQVENVTRMLDEAKLESKSIKDPVANSKASKEPNPEPNNGRHFQQITHAYMPQQYRNPNYRHFAPGQFQQVPFGFNHPQQRMANFSPRMNYQNSASNSMQPRPNYNSTQYQPQQFTPFKQNGTQYPMNNANKKNYGQEALQQADTQRQFNPFRQNINMALNGDNSFDSQHWRGPNSSRPSEANWRSNNTNQHKLPPNTDNNGSNSSTALNARQNKAMPHKPNWTSKPNNKDPRQQDQAKALENAQGGNAKPFKKKWPQQQKGNNKMSPGSQSSSNAEKANANN